MKQTISGYRLGLSKKDRLEAKLLHDRKKPQVPLPTKRVGWKKALRKLEACREERDMSIQEFFTLLSGSVSRTSVGEDIFVSRLCKILGPHVISTDDAMSLSKKLLSQRKTGYIVAKDLMSVLDIQEGHPSHVVFPDWLLQRQDFCAIQNNDTVESSVRNLRVVSAARVTQALRTTAENKCIFNWMKLNSSFLTKHHSEKLMDFCREVEFKEYPEKTIIFQRGDFVNPGAYMILTGIVYVTKNGSKLSTLSADGFFGEKSLLGQGEHANYRSVTVETAVPTKVLFLPKHIFSRVVSNPTQYPARQDIALFLCNYCPPFRHFPFEHILDSSRWIAIENYNGLNQPILRQNDRPRGLYVVKSGVVDITRVISIHQVLASLEEGIFYRSEEERRALEREVSRKSDAMVRLPLATLRRGNIIGEACLASMSRHSMNYSALTASESVEVYYLSEVECLSHLFKSEFGAEGRDCVADITQFTESRRVQDADLVIKYEQEIRDELMQRRLKRLNLQPIRNSLGGVSVMEKNYPSHTTPPKQSKSPYRDQYNHRLNCLGLGLEGAVGLPQRGRRATSEGSKTTRRAPIAISKK